MKKVAIDQNKLIISQSLIFWREHFATKCLHQKSLKTFTKWYQQQQKFTTLFIMDTNITLWLSKVLYFVHVLWKHYLRAFFNISKVDISNEYTCRFSIAIRIGFNLALILTLHRYWKQILKWNCIMFFIFALKKFYSYYFDIFFLFWPPLTGCFRSNKRWTPPHVASASPMLGVVVCLIFIIV